MPLLIAYILVNIIISVILDNSKYRLRIASVAHAIVFTIVFAFMLLAQDGFIGDLLARLMGEFYAPMHEIAVYGGGGVISPLVIIELLVPILIVAVGAIFTVKVVEYVCAKRDPFVKFKHIRQIFSVSFKSTVLADKIYIRNCVIRC